MGRYRRSAEDRCLGLGFLLVLVLGAVFAPLVLVAPRAAASPEVPDAAWSQRLDPIVAGRILGSLPVPAGARRDWYSTACGGATTYCLTDSRRHLSQLFMDTVSVLSAYGVTVYRHDSCWPDIPSAEGWAACLAEGRYRGLPLLIQVTQEPLRHSGGVESIPRLVVLVEGQDPRAWLAPVLPGWSELGLTPPQWAGHTACSRPHGTGCGQLSGTFTVAGASPALVEASWESWMTRMGYRILLRTCRTPAGTTSVVCSATAMRYLVIGGVDGVLARAAFQSTGPRSVRVSITTT